VLEKSEKQIIAEVREYLLEDGVEVGQLLIECAAKNTPFEKLSPEQQSLIIDYSNIFQEESKSRMKSVLEVAA
jgi:hypothetical protein